MNGKLMLAVLLVGALALFGCLGIGESTSVAPQPNPGGSGGYAEGISGAPTNTIPSQYQDASGRMVIKAGSAEVEVPQGTLEARYAALKGAVNMSGGFVYGTQYGESENQKYYYVTVKLPPAAFEAFPQELAKIGDVKTLNTGTDDVTEQYVDLNVRIDNLKAEKARLLEFYNRTTNVSELLEVEREVTRVQTEIEQLTAQKLGLERRAELATMQVRIYEQAPIVDRTVMVPLGGLINLFLQAISLSISIIVAIAGFVIPLFIGLGVLAAVILGLKKLTSKGKK